MADPVSRLSCGDEYLELRGLMSDEMALVKRWTGLKNRQAFYDALIDEDPEAIQAAFTLARRRATDKPEAVRFNQTRVNLDDLRWTRVVDGRQVDWRVELDDDGKPLMACLDDQGRPMRDEDGEFVKPSGSRDERVGPVLILTDDGKPSWFYVDSGDDVLPTTEPTTSGSNGSSTTDTTAGDSSDSPSPHLEVATV